MEKKMEQRAKMDSLFLAQPPAPAMAPAPAPMLHRGGSSSSFGGAFAHEQSPFSQLTRLVHLRQDADSKGLAI